ncbi:MAG TPA: hypothetical protein VJ965_03785 [Anaerolineales bacterium]|nr:hypothetical protein [Anaerolineales bacterium]
MKKILVWGCIVFLVQLACQFQPAIQTATPPPFPSQTPTEPPSPAEVPGYPLEAGNYWLYEGTVAYEQNDEEIEETIEWRVQVLEKVERHYVTGYRLRGSLYDLAFYTPGKLPSEYVILQTGGRYYNVDLNSFDRLKDENDLLVGLLNEYDLFLELPLEEGKHFCEAEQLTRDDGWYCWLVGEPAYSEYGPAFPLSYRTNPDFSQLTFVPGVGFTAFNYHHNGSVSDVNVQLMDYSIGGE